MAGSDAAVPPRLSIGQLFAPRRVAVFGASDDRSKWGGRIIHYLDLHGFDGEIVPINPRRDTVRGRTCYPRIGDAPPVDVAVVAVPTAAVPATVAECAAAGVGACVIITTGFAEVGPEGEALQDEIVGVARAAGMRLVGPNCLGLINLRNGMALTSARVLDVEALVRGHIGLVSQSGAVMLSVYNRAHDAGIGFSQLVSVGNQADLEICDFFEHMVGDPDTHAICLQIEGLLDGGRFLALLREAREAGKPVVVVKTGRSAGGQAAARSHTASLAGSYPVFAAACREAGAILVDDPDVMVLLADFLLRVGRPSAGGIGIVSPSGGINGIVVDRLADHGLRMAVFGEPTRAALAAVMLPTHLANPVDLGARRPDIGEGAAVAGPAVAAVAADPDVGLLLVPLTTMPNYEASVEALLAAVQAAGKPALFVVTPGSVATGVRDLIRRSGIASCDRLDDALRMLAAWTACEGAPVGGNSQLPHPEVLAEGEPRRAHTGPACFEGRLQRPPQHEELVDAHSRPVSLANEGGSKSLQAGYLSEPEAKALLASAGLRVTREEVVRHAGEARAAADRIGYPVVLKGVSHTVVHKSDAGLVRLGLATPDAVEAAFGDVWTILRALDPDAESCVVAEMASGAFELIVGVKQDPVFGPAVMVGAGGVLVELLADVEIGLAPLSRETATAMLRRLRVWPLLEGYREGRRLDIDAVTDALVTVGALAAGLGGRLLELDINPLLVRRDGEGVVALDARAVIG